MLAIRTEIAVNNLSDRRLRGDVTMEVVSLLAETGLLCRFGVLEPKLINFVTPRFFGFNPLPRSSQPHCTEFIHDLNKGYIDTYNFVIKRPLVFCLPWKGCSQ